MEAAEKKKLVHAGMGILGQVVILVGATMIHSGLGIAYGGWVIYELAKDLLTEARHNEQLAAQQKGIDLLSSMLTRPSNGEKDKETRH